MAHTAIPDRWLIEMVTAAGTWELKPLGCPGGCGTDFDFRQKIPMDGKLPISSERTFCRPAAQSPFVAPFGETHRTQAKSFSGPEPVGSGGHIRLILFQPINIHTGLPHHDLMQSAKHAFSSRLSLRSGFSIVGSS